MVVRLPMAAPLLKAGGGGEVVLQGSAALSVKLQAVTEGRVWRTKLVKNRPTVNHLHT